MQHVGSTGNLQPAVETSNTIPAKDFVCAASQPKRIRRFAVYSSQKTKNNVTGMKKLPVKGKCGR